jgi:hypothetical protein
LEEFLILRGEDLHTLFVMNGDHAEESVSIQERLGQHRRDSGRLQRPGVGQRGGPILVHEHSLA